MPDENQHICAACEDEQSEARALVFKSMGISAALSPVLLILLTFAAAVYDIKLIVDDRLTLAILAAYAAVVAAMFKSKK